MKANPDKFQFIILGNKGSHTLQISDITKKLLPPFFSIRVFFQGHWQLTGLQGKGGDHLLFHSPTHEHADIYLELCTWNDIFNCNAYQTATRWDLPPYWISIWLIDDLVLIFVCLFINFILGFVTRQRYIILLQIF